MANKSKCRKQQYIIWQILAILVLLSCLACVFGYDTIYRQLDDWMLIPRPERLTELYFSDHTNLPTTYNANQQQKVEFTIHNVEYRTTVYKYIVTQNSEDGKTSKALGKGNLTLDQNTIQKVDIPITLTDLGNRSQIKITLEFNGIDFGQNTASQQTQSIYYWVNKVDQR